MATTEFLRSDEIISHEPAALDLANGEFLIGVRGRACAYVDEIEFVTNKRIFAAFPEKGGVHPFSLLLPWDSSLKIRGVFGRSADTLSV